MAMQRSLARLRMSPHYKALVAFKEDSGRTSLKFGTEVTSTVRED